MYEYRWLSKIEAGEAKIVIVKLKEHDGSMKSAELRKELGVDRDKFIGYLNTLRRLGLVRFSNLYPYEDTFRVKLVEQPQIIVS